MSTAQPSGTSFPHQLEHIQENMRALSREQPRTMEAFASLHRATSEEGVLDTRTKEIIALAIAVFARCDGCIAFHTHDALKAGATKDEILDALGVAILMGGGPSMIYSTHVVEAIEQFQAGD